MKKSLVAAVIALLGASPAFATGAFHVRLASGEIAPGSSCSRQTQNIPSGKPYTAVRCPGSGSALTFTVNATYPTDRVGDTFRNRVHLLSPDGSPSGTVCYQVCYAVVKNGQSRNSAVFSCGTIITRSLTGQYIEDDPGFALATVQPQDTTGTACSGSNDCTGADLLINYTRIIDGTNCPANFSGNVDFTSDSELYP